MRVRDVMTKTPVTCNPDTNASVATELMFKNDCGTLPVVKDGDILAGIVTDRDLLVAVATRNIRPSELCVEEVMHSPVVCCKPSDDVDSVLSTMGNLQVRRLPVVDESNQLVGVISVNDIILRSDRKPTKDSAATYEDVMLALKGICQHSQTQIRRSSEVRVPAAAV